MRAVATIFGLILLLSSATASAQAVDGDGLFREPFLVVDPGMHTALIKTLDSDAAGRFLVTGSDDKTVRIWSAADGRLQRTIRVPAGTGNLGKVYAVAISPDGATVAAAGYTGADSGNDNIYLFDRASGQQTGRISALPNVIHRLAFSPDGRSLAAAFGDATGVRLFNTRTWQQIAADTTYGDSSYGIAFAVDGRIASTAYDGKVLLYGPSLDKPQTVVAPDGKQPYGIAFSPDGSRLAIGYVDTWKLTVLDGRTLGKVSAANTNGVDNGNLGAVAWSPDGKLLYAGGTWGHGGSRLVRAWDGGGLGVARDYPVTQDTIFDLRPLVGDRLAAAAADPRLLVIDRAGAIRWQAEPQTADFRDQTDQMRLSADGTRVRFGFEQFGKSPARFDLRQRRLDRDQPADTGLTAARTSGLDIKDWQATMRPTLADKPLQLDQYEWSESLSITRDGSSFVLGSIWSVRRFDAKGKVLWTIPVPSIAWAVNTTSDDRVAVIAYGDGTIRWHRMTDGQELLAFFPHRDGKRWVAWTPLGHYVASPGGEDLIQWQINRGLDAAPEVYSASRFRDQFYRPDVIDRVLDELDPQKALEAADRAAGKARTTVKSVAEETPPRVAIIDPAEGTVIDKPELTVAYTIEDRPGTGIKRVRLLLDGRVVGDQRNLTVPAGGRLNSELRVSLQGSASTLTMLAESDKGSSDPATISIRRNATDEDYKPTLYVLSIGVSHFRNAPSLDLRFADADATAFVRRLKQQEHGIYGRVIDRTLINQEATGAEIARGLQWLERSMSSRDVAAVFISTHGANDSDGQFVLLPSDVDLQDEISLRYTGVRFNDVRGTLGRLAERGKTLVFLDACHSGNIIPGARAADAPDVVKVASDLASAETGVIVFSSSGAKQFSMESPKFGHGYFTEALLEAFDGKSDRPPPWLHVSDLQIWLSERVKELSNGAQTPTTAVPFERFTNPVIYRVGNSAG
jgi:WD40 repeat protein